MITFEDITIEDQLDIAWDKDKIDVVYDKAYFEKYTRYENTEISKKLNTFRVNFSNKYATTNYLLDFGIGSGEFIKNNQEKFCLGYDINEHGINWLKEQSRFLDPYKDNMLHVSVITFWDSLEHLREPTDILNRMVPGQVACISIPVFDNLFKLKENKHYRPGEHFFYPTIPGMIRYMKLNSFECLEVSDQETLAGRENIFSFAFKKI